MADPADSLDGVIYLSKSRRGLKPRQARVFKGELILFKSGASQKAAETITLTRVGVMSGFEKMRKKEVFHGFRLTTPDGKSFEYYLPDSTERDRWVAFIRAQGMMVPTGGAGKEKRSKPPTGKWRRLTTKFASSSDFTELSRKRSDTVMTALKPQQRFAPVEIGEDTRFGAPFERACNLDTETVPLVVTLCSECVRMRGLEEVGIFRLSGSQNVIERYKERYDRGLGLTFENESNVHNASGLLKLYFRMLPEPIISQARYATFIAYAEELKEVPESLATVLKQQVELLPVSVITVLQIVTDLLFDVARHASTNKMGVKNLALLFGPTMLAPREDSLESLGDTSAQCRIISNLVQFKEYIFGSTPLDQVTKIQMSGNKGKGGDKLPVRANSGEIKTMNKSMVLPSMFRGAGGGSE